MPTEVETQRFFDKVDFDPSGCWLWTGCTSRGYGRFSFGQRQGMAHRFAWTLTNGTIPDGLTIDHLCRTRHCVNPDHLEPVPNQVNVIRGLPFKVRPTHCPKGHEFTPENTYYSKNRRTGERDYRRCEICYHTSRDGEYWKAYRERRKARGLVGQVSKPRAR